VGPGRGLADPLVGGSDALQPGATPSIRQTTGPIAPPDIAAPFVSPLRPAIGPDAALPPIDPAEPIPTYLEGPGSAALGPDRDVEPAVPDEARERIIDGAFQGAAPLVAADRATLHVRFAANAAPDRLVGAMEVFKVLLRDRPGATRVVLHLPAPSGHETLPMELRRGVAYDAELLAEVSRRLGDGIVELHLA
ncbi:MAG: hypothetical protein H0V74_03205, partial [Chloroflexi bacterium]|nr:hypothetical protein [Chloroflexota bacterium]